MSRIYHVFLCAAVIVMMITAGCTLPGNTSGAQPLITETQTPVATPAPTAPAAAATNPPGAAGTQASGTCAADINNDPANCGGCGYACPANALCQQGQCFCKEGYTAENNGCVVAPAGTGSGTAPGTGCPTGMSPCPDGYCYDLAFSAENCGICGNTCPSGMTCSASTCTNLPAEVTPETTAVVTTTAAVTTTVTVTTTVSSGSSGTGIWGGSFAKLCKSPFTYCSNSDSCVDLKTNKTHCGTCTTKCTKFQTCVNGACKTTAVEIGPTLSKIAVKPSLVKELAVKDVIGPGPGY